MSNIQEHLNASIPGPVSFSFVPVMLPGSYFPEVKGKIVGIMTRQVMGLEELIELRSFPFRAGEQAESIHVSIGVREDKALSSRSGHLMAQEVEKSAMYFLTRTNQL